MSVGTIVFYRLNEDDVKRIRHDREGWHIPGNEPKAGKAVIPGNEPKAEDVGDEFPMMIVKVWGDQPSSTAAPAPAPATAPDSLVNGQVFLDGPDVLWVQSVKVGEGPGTFSAAMTPPPKPPGPAA